MAVSHLRPVVYKGCTIHVEKRSEDKYAFTVKKEIKVDLFGIANSLLEAFEEARGMIDKLEDDDE